MIFLNYEILIGNCLEYRGVLDGSDQHEVLYGVVLNVTLKLPRLFLEFDEITSCNDLEYVK